MVGVFHAKGWWSKNLFSPSKVCFPWVLRIRGVFPEKNNDNSQKSVEFANLGANLGVSVNLLCSRTNTPNSEKHPVFANRVANRPLFGLVCRNGS